MHCTLAASGAEALDLVSRKESFTFALIDLVMPQMDGAALVRALRERGGVTPRHIVLLSSLGTRLGDNVTKLFAATLAKPTKSAEVQQTLLRLVGGTGSHVARPARTEEQFPELRVLVVEDNTVNQRVVRLILRKLGVAADVAHHGRAAVACAQQHEYDLILMDLQMPEMDGFEATRTIRRERAAGRQPMIVALTANALQGDEEACLAAGMDAYMSKPARADQLAEMLRRAKLRLAAPAA
jgi:CheY-like chemotaxis protein